MIEGTSVPLIVAVVVFCRFIQNLSRIIQEISIFQECQALVD